MPIARINPDGTVKIVNSKTGQTLDVKADELPKYSPSLVVDYQEKLQAQQGEQAALELAQKGGMSSQNYENLVKTNPALALKISQNGAATKTPVTAEQRKKEDSLSGVNNFIKNLETHYQAAGGGEVNVPILSNIVGAQKDIGGALGFNDQAKVYNSEKQGFAATLKSLTGDTGVMTDQDFARLAQLLPSLGAKPEVAKSLLNDLRSQVSAKFGGGKTETTINPKAKGLLETILPETTDFVNTIGKQRTNLQQEALINPQRAQEDAVKQAKAYTDNANPVNLVQNLLSGQKEAKTLARPTAEIVGDVSSVLGGIGTLKSGGGLLKKLFTSTGTLGATRDSLAKDVVVNTKPLIEAGDKYVASIDPAAQKAWETLKPAIKESTNLPELLQKLTNWGDKAYTKSGDKRAITEGLLKSHLYQQGRDIIKSEAPAVADVTAQMAKGFGRKKLIGKGASIAGGAAITGATYTLLNKLLGQKGQ